MQYSNIPVGCTPPSKESQLFISLMFFLVPQLTTVHNLYKIRRSLPKAYRGTELFKQSKKALFSDKPIYRYMSWGWYDLNLALEDVKGLSIQ